MSSGKNMPLIGYWNMRGLAQPIRHVFEYVGENYEDKLYDGFDASGIGFEEWNQDKGQLGLSFPNLPYYIENDLKLTQTVAILQHVGGKFNLDGESPHEKAYVNVVLEQVQDLRNSLIKHCPNPQFTCCPGDTLTEEYRPILDKRLTQFENKLSESEWIVGKISVADFFLYELLHQHIVMDKKVLQKFPKLQKFVKSFEDLPSIKNYMASEAFKKLVI